MTVWGLTYMFAIHLVRAIHHVPTIAQRAKQQQQREFSPLLGGLCLDWGVLSSRFLLDGGEI